MNRIDEFIMNNLNVIKELVKTKSGIEVFKLLELDCHSTTFYNHLKKFIKLDNYKEVSRKFNAFYFDKIDTNEKAYLLGYIVSDACLYKPDNTLILNSAISDVEVFEKFIKYLDDQRNVYKINKSDNPKRQDMIRLEFRSEHLLNSLHSLGIPFNKSKQSFKIPNIDKEFYNAFITGYFDGDGCIYNWKYRNFELSFTEKHREILEDLQEYFLTNYGIRGQIRLRKTYHQLRICGINQCMKFFDNIYMKEFALTRKYDKFVDIIPC